MMRHRLPFSPDWCSWPSQITRFFYCGALAVFLQATASAQSSGVDHFSWPTIATPTPAGVPVAVSIIARDLAGGVVTNFQGEVSISAIYHGSPPTVLITEVETLTTKRVEIANLTTAPVDVSGWRVILYDSQSWPSPRTTFTVPSGSVMPARGLFQVRSGGTSPGTYPLFNCGVALQWGSPSQFPYVAVALLDASGQKVDTFFAISALPVAVTTPPLITESDWSGPPAIGNANQNLTHQRIGVLDHNNAADWATTNNSFGLVNTNLQLPLLAASAKLPIQPASVPFSNGTWSGNVVIGGIATNVLLRADDRKGHAGDSSTFDVVAPPALEILLPPQAFESIPGFVGFGSVSVPGTLATNLSVRLSSNDTNEITVAASTTIFAGEFEGYFRITNYSDGIPDGPKRVAVTAAADGFTSVQGIITNYDASPLTLSLILPSLVSETNGWVSNAVVQVSGSVAADVSVSLYSGNTNEIRVPTGVTIPMGSNMATFAFEIVNDGKLDGTQHVALSASLSFWQNATEIIDVTDAATAKLGLTLPPQGVEGSVMTNVGKVFITGSLPTNLVVGLSASHPARLLLPPTLSIAASQTSAVFSVTLPDDLFRQGNQVVNSTASAAGFSFAEANTSVNDNDVDHLVFTPIGSPQYLGQPFTIALYAKTVDGQTVTNFSGAVNIGAVNGATSPPGLMVQLTNGFWSGPISVTNGGMNVWLAGTAAGGVTGTSNPFKVQPPAIRQIALPTQDLIYDPFTARLYTSVTAAGGVRSNSLTRINPITGAIESSTYLGVNPNRLAIADNGQFLYAGLDGESAVRQFNLASQTPGPAFSIGAGLYALDIEVMPAHPEVVAVSRSQFAPFGPVGVAIYDHGVKRTNETSSPNVIAFGNTNVLYGYWNYTTAFGFYRYIVASNGLVEVGSSGPLLHGYADIQFDAGKMFTTLGNVFDPDQMKMLGQLPVNGVLRSDAAANRVFVIAQESGSWVLFACDRTTLALCGKLVLPGISGTPSSLVRWGTNGLAFRTSGGQIFIVNTELLPPAICPDVALQQGPISVAVITNSNITFTLVATNKGSATATAVMVQDRFPAGAAFVSAAPSRGTWELKEDMLSCQIGSLLPGESASIAVTLRLSKVGLNTNSASILASESDAWPADNHAASVVSVVATQSMGTTMTRLLSAADLLWVPAAQRLFATVRGDDPHFGNQLVRLNPSTGSIEAKWFIGSAPGRMTMSSDQHFLYVSVDDGTRIRRFDLTTLTSDLTIDMDNGIRIDDLSSPTGLPESIAVTRYVPDSTAYGGMAVYDSGLLRYYDGTSYQIEAAEQGTGLYNFVQGSAATLQRLFLGTNLVSIEAAIALPESYAADFKCDAGLLFTGQGEVVFGPVPTRIGTMTNLGSATTRIVASDAQAGRFYNLGQSSANAVLRAYSRSRLQFLGSSTVGGLAGTVQAFTPCGTNGFAFCTTGKQLFLFTTELAGPANPSSDLCVSQTLPGQVAYSSPFTCVITVSNRGPNAASDVVLTDILPIGGAVVSATGSQGTLSATNNLVSCSFGTLAPGGVATLSLTIVTHESGVLKNSAIATSANLEANPDDNITTATLPASFLKQVVLPVQDLVYDPARARIYAAIGPTGGLYSNAIVEIDAVSSAIGQAIPQVDTVGKLAISDDSQFLYAGFNSTGGVGRVNLAMRTNDLFFSIGASGNFRYTAGDMEVLPGQPHAVAVSINDWSGNVALTVYDDSLPRSNSVPRREYGGLYPIVFSTNSSTLYQTVAGYFRTIRIDATGATLISEVISAAPVDGLEADQGYVFYNSGYQVNPVSNVVVTNFGVYALVKPDLASGLVYFVTVSGNTFRNYQMILRAFDSQTARELWSVPFSYAMGIPARITKLGTNGVAVVSDTGRLFLLKSGELSPPSADLQVTQTFTPARLAAGQSTTCTVTVRNLGPGNATGVVVSNPVPSGLVILAATTSKGAILQTNPAVLCNLGSLANGETATLTMICSPANAGSQPNQPFVSLTQPDPNPANNSVSGTIEVLPPIVVTVGDAFAKEGNSGNSAIGFPVTLSSTSAVPIYFRYQTGDGTAVAGSDYVTNQGLFTFAAGPQISRTLTLSSAITGNTLVGSNRNFVLNLHSVTNAILVHTQAIATIHEDDFQAISITNVALMEGALGITNASFKLVLTPASTVPVLVDYQTLSLSATTGSDFVARAGTLQFAAGETNLTLQVPVYSDLLPEINEDFLLMLSNPQGGTLAVNQARGSILNDDALPVLAWSDIRWQGDSLRLKFPSVAGRFYRVEKSSTLIGQSWVILTDNVPGTGGMVEIPDQSASQSPHAFYRLILLP